MSRSTLQAIWPGAKHENVREFGNSWGTAPIVWDAFCVRYFGKDSHWWVINAGKPEGQAFWDLWKDSKIPQGHRAVFLWTLDHIYVTKADYRRFARDLRAFLDDTHISANRVNHWPLIAQFVEMEPEYPALGIWCTSVTADPYHGAWDEAKEEYGPFDWKTAHDLYSELDSETPAARRSDPGECR